MSIPAAALAALMDNDDLLSEFLLRLPPQPSSLPRASLVCNHWHRLVTDPGFRRRFRAHHRNSPLIGVFEDRMDYPFFSHSLVVSERLLSADNPNSSSHIVRTEDSGLGWVILSPKNLQMWEWKVCSEGVARWVLRKTEKMYKILGMM
ncbi:hypothetical protein PR202_ga20785 [Eleusine coracana subsp. coracana]|uniref:F-box domain-containing protein n=1 Tax=Eleusine coracana subsp. coracana TaxID=191504 RepID=A0AAV5CZ69_ELECO|nr:hypothetical protein QOZ80_8AG0628170 [Eleusine coracana subsp. coracana]GJN03349.1 hypothetical protein PR202_ga20785 [Eleusine coracana subsp. coracana]